MKTMLKTKMISTGLFIGGLLISSLKLQATEIKKPVTLSSFVFSDTSLPFSPYDSVLFTISAINEAEMLSPEIKLNKQAISFSDAYLEINGEMLTKIKKNNPGYFKTMDAIFTRRGLPVQLKYLAIVESKLKTTAVSRVGAVGAWQFMPVTARFLKLKVNEKQDDRKNFYKSTEAAARYLRDLHNMFDDWLLVLAAYNCGPGNVMKAIKKTGTRDFWKLQYALPKETRDHVKKFISTHYYYEGSGGITTLTKNERVKHEKAMTAYMDLVQKQIRPNHMLETEMILNSPAEKISLYTENNISTATLLESETYITKL